MKKYYKIPITEKIINYQGKSLYNIANNSFPEVIDVERERIEKTKHENPISINHYRNYTESIISMMNILESKAIPKDIFIYQENEFYHELITDEEFTTDCKELLEVYSEPLEQVLYEIEETNYDDKIVNYFNIVKQQSRNKQKEKTN